MKTHREPLERIYNQAGLSWRHAATEVLRHTNDKEIWPPHSQVTLTEEAASVSTDDISQNIETLKDMALNMAPMTEITCKLCDIKIYELIEMRIHLMSQQHADNLKRFNLTEN